MILKSIVDAIYCEFNRFKNIEAKSMSASKSGPLKRIFIH